MSDRLADLLATHAVVLLDGATGTELERRGFASSLPLWTAEAARRAPQLLQQIHLEYLATGAHIVTANTFRTNPYTLQKVGREAEAAALTAETVAIARAACRAAGHGLVAGCLAPLEDCYHPERVPPPDVTQREHGAHAANLAASGVDLLLVETMGTAREAHAAAEAALATGLPVLVSFILDPQGDGDALLSGEEFEVALAHLRSLAMGEARVRGFLVNCTSRAVALAALSHLLDGRDVRPVGAYPNLGGPAGDGWRDDPAATPASFAAWAVAARARGARLLGGCCGTTPAHLRAAALALHANP